MKNFTFLILVVFYTGCLAQAKIIKIADLQAITKNKSDTLYVINFWATWCKPCVQELPAFEKLNVQYQNQKVKVLLISLDFKKELPKLNKFINDKHLISSVMLLDEPNYNNWIPMIDKDWSGSIPATLLILGGKQIHQFYEQAFEYEELNTLILKIIN